MKALAQKAFAATLDKLEHFGSKEEKAKQWAVGCGRALDSTAEIAKMPKDAQNVVAVVKDAKMTKPFCLKLATKMAELNFPQEPKRVIETTMSVFKAEFVDLYKELKRRNEFAGCVKHIETEAKDAHTKIIAELKRTKDFCTAASRAMANAGFPAAPSKKMAIYG